MIKRFSSKLTEYYKVLELKPGANTEEIKAAYNRLVKKYHPDTTLMADKKLATEKFKLVHEARTRLLSKNPEDGDKVEKASADRESAERGSYGRESAERENYERKEWESQFKSYEDFKKHFDEREKYKEQERKKREEERRRRYADENSSKKSNEWSASYTETNSQSFQPNIGFAMLSFVLVLGYLLIVNSTSRSSNYSQNSVLQSHLQRSAINKSASLKKSEDDSSIKSTQNTQSTEEPKKKGKGINFQYLYKGQSGQHKRFTLLTEDDDEHSIFKCNTCSAVVSKANLELHVEYYAKEYQRMKNLKKVNSK